MKSHEHLDKGSHDNKVKKKLWPLFTCLRQIEYGLDKGRNNPTNCARYPQQYGKRMRNPIDRVSTELGRHHLCPKYRIMETGSATSLA